MGLYERHCSGQSSIIDNQTFHGTRDLDTSALTANEAAAADLVRRQHAITSVCHQFEQCLSENRRIVVSSGGFIKRLFLWGGIGFFAIISIAASGKITALGRFIPLAIAFLAIAVTTGFRYWGQPDSGTDLVVFIAGGAFILTLVGLYVIAVSQDLSAAVSYEPKQTESLGSGIRGFMLARGVVIGAGMVSPNITRATRVNKGSTLGEIGLLDAKGKLSDAVAEKWACRISEVVSEHVKENTRSLTRRLQKAVEKASKRGAGGTANVELGSVAEFLLRLSKIKDPDVEVARLSAEYRLPSAFLLRLSFESEQDFKFAKDHSALFAKTVSETEALSHLVVGDKTLVATKKNSIVGFGTIPPQSKNSKFNGSPYETTREVEWAFFSSESTKQMLVSSVSTQLNCPKSHRRTITEVDWDGYTFATEQLRQES
jgi:hypothetical protein